MIESYVVQIYRRDPAQRQLTGTVEAIGAGTRRRFSSLEELWDCLNAPSARHRRQRRGAGPGEPQP